MAHVHDHGSHGHGSHGHAHHGDPNSRAFAVAIVLNTLFVAVEFVFGLIAHSTALIADAGHNLADVLGLILAGGAAMLARRAPSGRYTYGLRSTSIMAALANAVFLLVASGAIGWEAALRFSAPPVVTGTTVIAVAGAGIVINGLSAWLFMRGSRHDLNLRAAYLHMAADAAVSLGVVAAGVAMLFTGWYWLDPLIGLVIVAVIVTGTWAVLRDALRLALSAVPAHIELAEVEGYLRGCPGVADIHDLHIWGMSTTESALTVHLVMPGGYPGDAFIDDISRTLHERYRVQHSTLQVELGTTEHFCVLHECC